MKAKRSVKAPAAKPPKAAAAQPVSPFREVTKAKPLARPAKIDAEARQARAATARAHFHRDPFPPMVGDEHEPQGPHTPANRAGDTDSRHDTRHRPAGRRNR